MAQVDDKVLLTFISKELMEQDVRLAEDLVVDERCAAFLSQNNAVRKSLAATKALMSVGVRGPGSRPTPTTAKGPGLPQVPLRAPSAEGLHLPCGNVDAQRPPQLQLAGRASPSRQVPEGRRGWRRLPRRGQPTILPP